jgi:bifunctional non-homologous end joining protein LigD
MGLRVYKKKRSFAHTPEPRGGMAKGAKLHFVVQEHAASHLHYDFRLEMEGVLKSWAVPKGPSTDPRVKRLAVRVEDHPYDYRNFEGTIPKGQYGGGTVIVWDEGTYEATGRGLDSIKKQEKTLLSQLGIGKIQFSLQGTKLRGDFALVKSNYPGKENWLLMKLKDKYAKTTDVTKRDKSVKSGKPISQVAKSSEERPRIIQDKNQKKKVPKTAKESRDHKKNDGNVRFPTRFSPMLATLIDKPFDKEGWIFEIKWDGYRCIAVLHQEEVNLQSRGEKSFNEKFYPVYHALETFKLEAVLDGEIVVLNPEGVSNFSKLQHWKTEADGELKFYVFDLLWLDGQSLEGLPLIKRRDKLLTILPKNSTVIPTETIESRGVEFFEAAKNMGLEGIMAKKSSSLYQEAVRSKDWLKIKTGKRQEVVIGGYTQKEGSTKAFSSLLVGVFSQNKLHYIGKVGTGFSESLQKTMIRHFQPLVRRSSPFEVLPDVHKASRFGSLLPKAKATWLKPELVCEVEYTELTPEGVMRHPSFKGMRMDKKTNEVKMEIPKPAGEVLKKETAKPRLKKMTKKQSETRKSLLNPADQTLVKEIDGQSLHFTNLGKLYWPKQKITKRDLLNYYYQVAPFILPYLKDRPQSLNRYPNGIEGKNFYQKDVKGKVPDWIKTFPYRSAEDQTDKEFMVCTGEASLLYMASLGCIEMNPWSSRTSSPDQPDWCVIDLDPDKNKFEKVVEVAQVTHRLLQSAGVPAFCKTSGSTGIHIYIPLGAKYSYDESKELARLIATMVNRELPGFTSILRPTSQRKGKIYLDFLQNRPQATLASVYSVRPRPGAPVSTPLDWEEVKKGVTPGQFTIKDIVSRLKEMGEIFAPVLGKGIDLPKHMKKLRSLSGL